MMDAHRHDDRLRALISDSGEPWEPIDGNAWGWTDIGWSEVPNLPCSPCFGAVGPNAAAWRHRDTGYLRCSGCLWYSLAPLTPEQRRAELARGVGTVTATLSVPKTSSLPDEVEAAVKAACAEEPVH